MKIGIGITSFRRPETDRFCIDKICEFAPKESKIVVIQDVDGISKAKNNCLALLDECEEIFLFDSDCYPIVYEWHIPYINSIEPHMSFTFSKLSNGGINGNRILLSQTHGLNSYQNPCGCMLYINKKCIDVVGGFDEKYEGYSYEHVDYSVRAFNAGLTSAKFLDVPNSLELFHSMDYYGEVKSSLTPNERLKYISKNRPLYFASQDSKEFKAYK